MTPTIGIQGGFQLQTLKDGVVDRRSADQRLFPASVAAGARGAAKPATAADRPTREALVTAQER